jgi:hypothetical protein
MYFATSRCTLTSGGYLDSAGWEHGGATSSSHWCDTHRQPSWTYSYWLWNGSSRHNRVGNIHYTTSTTCMLYSCALHNQTHQAGLEETSVKSAATWDSKSRKYTPKRETETESTALKSTQKQWRHTCRTTSTRKQWHWSTPHGHNTQ